MKGYDDYLRSIQSRNYPLDLVPLCYIDETMCKVAVGANGMNIKHVPTGFRDKILCMTAMRNTKAMSFIPECIKDFDFYNRIVRINGLNLKHVPDHYIDDEMCEIALRSNNMAMQYVPVKMVTPKLCEIVLKRKRKRKIIIKTPRSPHIINLKRPKLE